VKPKGKWTSGVERKTSYAAGVSSYIDGAKVLLELADLQVSSSEVDRTGQKHGAALDRRQRADEERWLQPVDPLRKTPPPEISCEKLVIQADATSVLTRPGEEHKSVYCGTVFPLESRGKSGNRPFLSQRLYTASAVNMADFSTRLKALGWRAGLRGAQAAFVGDGAPCLWSWAEKNLPAGTLFIQDFWHVCERLAELAQLLFPDGWKRTFKKWKKWLRSSRVESVLAALRRLHQNRRGQVREEVGKELGYLEKGQHRMDYARYEKEGWLIGSGAIEGTCKHLVKSRFSITGAHWRRKNIPQVLALRLAIFNDEWDSYWQDQDRYNQDWENEEAA
jgi:hypothetical protein